MGASEYRQGCASASACNCSPVSLTGLLVSPLPTPCHGALAARGEWGAELEHGHGATRVPDSHPDVRMTCSAGWRHQKSLPWGQSRHHFGRRGLWGSSRQASFLHFHFIPHFFQDEGLWGAFLQSPWETFSKSAYCSMKLLAI